MDKRLKIAFIAFAILSACPIPIYFIVMLSKDKQLISSDISDWGDFGSYLSGTTGVLMAAANVIAFIYLTYEIHRLNEANSKKERTYHRNQLRAELKREIYNTLNHSTNRLLFIPLKNLEKKTPYVSAEFETCKLALADIEQLYTEIELSGATQSQFIESYKDVLRETMTLDESTKPEHEKDYQVYYNYVASVRTDVGILLKSIKQSIESDLKD